MQEDESYLNKRGLAHFWENIDEIKQDKLTAGTNITIAADNTISASQPTVGNATLTIQKNGTSAGTFTANATSNKTINITVPTTAADVSALPASTKYGASIAVSINTTDYKVTTTLKDQDGNTLGTAQVIDLPLESVVVNGSYDGTNKKIVLTLQNGNTIDIPVGDLISGLQSEITSTNKLDSDLVDDTNQTHKFMTSAEKTKLSGIAAGAEVNVQSDWNQATTTADDYIKNKPTLATVATSGSYNDLSNKPTNVSAFTNDAGYITSYTDNKTAQTLTKPTTSTTYYPVASASSSTNTADVKKFSGVSLSYSDDEGGAAELTLGKSSLNGSVAGSISLVDSIGATGHTTISGSGKSSTENHTLNTPNTSGRLVANSSSNSATGSATNPVYADGDGILHATTYTLEKSVPSNAVFTDTTYNDATTSVAGLMSAADKTKLNGVAAGAEVNVQANWTQTTTTADDYIKNKPNLAAVATSGSYNDLSNKPTIPTVDSSLSTSSTNAIQNKAVANALDEKVNVASVDLTGQTTTLLAQIKALGSAQKNYGRFYSKTDGGSANISDKPTGSTNASFVCVAYQSRNNGSSDYTYQVLCWIQADTNPYKATVTASSTSISWARQSADTGWVYLGEQSLSADGDTLTFTLPAQYDNYKVVFYGAMDSTASDGGWIDFIMYNGSTAISVTHQVQLVQGTTWSSATNANVTFAINGQSNPYAGVTIKFESYRAGDSDWRSYTGSFASNNGVGTSIRTSIVNGRATSGTQPTAFTVKSYGGNFNTGSRMRVWASNNSH